jgi:hypothetical protein
MMKEKRDGEMLMVKFVDILNDYKHELKERELDYKEAVTQFLTEFTLGLSSTVANVANHVCDDITSTDKFFEAIIEALRFMQDQVNKKKGGGSGKAID